MRVVAEKHGLHQRVHVGLRRFEHALSEDELGAEDVRREVARLDRKFMDKANVSLDVVDTSAIRPSQDPAPVPEGRNVLVVGEGSEARSLHRPLHAEEGFLGMVGRG